MSPTCPQPRRSSPAPVFFLFFFISTAGATQKTAAKVLSTSGSNFGDVFTFTGVAADTQIAWGFVERASGQTVDDGSFPASQAGTFTVYGKHDVPWISDRFVCGCWGEPVEMMLRSAYCRSSIS